MKQELKTLLLERLKNWNFIFHRRECIQNSHYGKVDEQGMFVPDDEVVLEEWSNEEIVDLLLNIGEKEISNDAEKIDNLLINK